MDAVIKSVNRHLNPFFTDLSKNQQHNMDAVIKSVKRHFDV